MPTRANKLFSDARRGGQNWFFWAFFGLLSCVAPPTLAQSFTTVGFPPGTLGSLSQAVSYSGAVATRLSDRAAAGRAWARDGFGPRPEAAKTLSAASSRPTPACTASAATETSWWAKPVPPSPEPTPPPTATTAPPASSLTSGSNQRPAALTSGPGRTGPASTGPPSSVLAPLPTIRSPARFAGPPKTAFSPSPALTPSMPTPKPGPSTPTVALLSG